MRVTVDSHKSRTTCGEKSSPRTYFSNDQLKFKLFKKPYRTTTDLMIISESLYNNNDNDNDLFARNTFTINGYGKHDNQTT